MKTLFGSDDAPEPAKKAADPLGHTDLAITTRAAQRLTRAIDQVLIAHGAPAELISDIRRDLQILLLRGLDALHACLLGRTTADEPPTRISWSSDLTPAADYARRRLERHTAQPDQATGPADIGQPPDQHALTCAACWPATPWPCDKAQRAAETALVVELLRTTRTGL
jgi:hypothetical protein